MISKYARTLVFIAGMVVGALTNPRDYVPDRYDPLFYLVGMAVLFFFLLDYLESANTSNSRPELK